MNALRTAEISGLFNISLGQLQWWDEHGVVSPKLAGHTRLYSLHDAFLAGIVAELKRKGVSLAKARRILASHADALLNAFDESRFDSILVISGGRISNPDLFESPWKQCRARLCSKADLLAAAKSARSGVAIIYAGEIARMIYDVSERLAR